MKLSKKFFSNSLVLETKQMEGIKGGELQVHWTCCGWEGADTSACTIDWVGDSASNSGVYRCQIKDDTAP